jgi:hypothetical protein
MEPGQAKGQRLGLNEPQRQLLPVGAVVCKSELNQALSSPS